MFFDSVRNNKRLVQIFLALIALPFAFWGVDSYVRGGGSGADLASVGDTKITQQQFDQAWRVQQDRMRQALGDSFRPESMNTPEARLAVLNSLVDQRLLLLEAAKGRLGASDEALREVIGRIPALQENGQFSMARYQSALAAQGLSQTQFEAQIRQDLTLQELVAAIGDTGIAASTETGRILAIQSEERQVAEFRIAPEGFAGQIKIDEPALRKFYEENGKRFEITEQARVEYVLFSVADLVGQAVVTDADLHAWYDSHRDRYQQPEERRASHILILAATGDADKDSARAKAEEVLKEVQKAPARFADLARKYSQDPGSAAKGGDLGVVARGTMVKPFEEAVFSLRENELSGLVQSEFGYHIIMVTGIRPGKQRSFAEVRPEIESELKQQAAQRRFAEEAEAFSNTVYEQPDSLQPAVERFKLKLQQSAWIPRNPPPEAMARLGPLGNAKALSAIFSEDSIKNKRNTEAIEVAPNTLLAARVIEHRPASVRPFEVVKSEIEATLKAQGEAALARSAGEARLAELRQGGADTVAWAPVRKLSRQDPRQLSPAAARAIFSADVHKLPAYVGAATGDAGYVLYKIVKVVQPEGLDEARRQALQREYALILGQEDFAAYLAGLRQRYKIDINKAALERKER
ncbi:MAG: SurA N-terminal domain-containing protein [Candidatus Accumulibacter sp.]|uniref:SurA N-terminal domain-containing protein n=1 Tax=Accumulibacter sp. TaxID=2053492 RepID=UPI001A5D91DA|nr:SurA N-terminal domain-containing protein [Accumulibacter sp.]MBL8392486.1 SurA N-terminal domain-containing protein [Accumulibacter sp.]HRD90147.1 SurA N-terminal domain-containing protein [Accumulibacter sp.]